MRKFYEIFAQGVLTPNRVSRWSRKFGLKDGTIEKWKRPPESDETPTGTGIRSYLDHTEYIIRDVYQTHPSDAREIALRYVHIVDELDSSEGKRTSVCHALAKTVKEYTDIILLRVDNEENENMSELFREVTQLQTAVNQLSACVKEQLKTGD